MKKHVGSTRSYKPWRHEPQKFHKGDLVDIDYVGEAVIEGSYRNLYGGDHADDDGSGNEVGYSVHPHYGGWVAWHYQSSISLVEHGQDQLVIIWKGEAQKVKDIETDPAWIIENWPKIRHRPSGNVLEYLMSRIGIDEPWGRHGEGWDYYANARRAMVVFDAALCSGEMALVDQAAEEYLAMIKAWQDRQSAGSQ